MLKTTRIIQNYRQISPLCTAAVEELQGFEKEFKSNRICVNPFQKAILAVGSAAMAIMDPRRGDMIATMGEVTGMVPKKNIVVKKTVIFL